VDESFFKIDVFLGFLDVNGELNDLYSSQNIIRVIISRILRWAGHVACRGKAKFIQSFSEET